MNRKNYLYSSGEFAKLTGVNKRTLPITMKSGCSAPKLSERTDTTTIHAFNLQS